MKVKFFYCGSYMNAELTVSVWLEENFNTIDIIHIKQSLYDSNLVISIFYKEKTEEQNGI